MKLDTYNQEGVKTGTYEAPDNLFSLPQNNALLYQVYTAKWANQRSVIAHAKTRGEVSGGGRKPWRQKGTGRTRHGSTRSPIWVGGGVTFGPTKERNYSKKVNKKMNTKAIFMVLSSKAKNKNIFIIDDLDYKEAKTKLGIKLLEVLNLNNSSNMVYGTKQDSNFRLVFRNIPKTNPHFINGINVIDILQKQNIIFSKSAMDELININAGKINIKHPEHLDKFSANRSVENQIVKSKIVTKKTEKIKIKKAEVVPSEV